MEKKTLNNAGSQSQFNLRRGEHEKRRDASWKGRSFKDYSDLKSKFFNCSAISGARGFKKFLNERGAYSNEAIKGRLEDNLATISRQLTPLKKTQGLKSRASTEQKSVEQRKQWLQLQRDLRALIDKELPDENLGSLRTLLEEIKDEEKSWASSPKDHRSQEEEAYISALQVFIDYIDAKSCLLLGSKNDINHPPAEGCRACVETFFSISSCLWVFGRYFMGINFPKKVDHVKKTNGRITLLSRAEATPGHPEVIDLEIASHLYSAWKIIKEPRSAKSEDEMRAILKKRLEKDQFSNYVEDKQISELLLEDLKNLYSYQLLLQVFELIPNPPNSANIRSIVDKARNTLESGEDFQRVLGSGGGKNSGRPGFITYYEFIYLLSLPAGGNSEPGKYGRFLLHSPEGNYAKFSTLNEAEFPRSESDFAEQFSKRVLLAG